jgi:hypothetical protein
VSIYVALTVIGIVIAAALFAPVRVDVSMATGGADAAAGVTVRARWLVFPLPGRAARPRRRRPPRRTRPRRPSRHGWQSIRAALQSPGFARRCVRLVAALARLARPDRMTVRGRIGLDDPADTGLFLGWLVAVRGRLASRRAIVEIEPDFSGGVIEGRADLHWSRSLASVLWPLVTFLLSPVVWRAAMRAHRSARPGARAAA